MPGRCHSSRYGDSWPTPKRRYTGFHLTRCLRTLRVQRALVRAKLNVVLILWLVFLFFCLHLQWTCDHRVKTEVNELVLQINVKYKITFNCNQQQSSLHKILYLLYLFPGFYSHTEGATCKILDL